MGRKTLIVDDEEDIRYLIEMVLEEAIADITLITASSGSEAVEKLKENPDTELIVCDYTMDNGNGGLVYKYVRENLREVPFILCTGGFIEDYEEFCGFHDHHSYNLYIQKPIDDDVLLQNVRKVFGDIEEYFDYVPISGKLYQSYIHIAPTCFIKLGESKWVKAVDSNLSIEVKSSQIEHFISKEKNISFYINKDEHKKFIFEIQKEIRKSLLTNDKNKSTIYLGEHALTISKKIFEEVGIDNHTKEFVEDVISNLFEKELNLNNPQIDKLKQIFKSDNYIADHTLMCIYLSGAILNNLPSWFSENNMKQLALASFFHDLFIDDEKLAKIKTDEQLQSLSSAEHKIVHEHISMAASAISSFADTNNSAEVIIQEHHELPDGTGFPRKLTAKNITGLSAVFIVAHDLTNFFFEHWAEKNQLIKYLKSKEDFYKEKVFLRPYQELLKIIQKS